MTVVAQCDGKVKLNLICSQQQPSLAGRLGVIMALPFGTFIMTPSVEGEQLTSAKDRWPFVVVEAQFGARPFDDCDGKGSVQ